MGKGGGREGRGIQSSRLRFPVFAFPAPAPFHGFLLIAFFDCKYQSLLRNFPSISPSYCPFKTFPSHSVLSCLQYPSLPLFARASAPDSPALPPHVLPQEKRERTLSLLSYFLDKNCLCSKIFGLNDRIS